MIERSRGVEVLPGAERLEAALLEASRQLCFRVPPADEESGCAARVGDVTAVIRVSAAPTRQATLCLAVADRAGRTHVSGRALVLIGVTEQRRPVVRPVRTGVDGSAELGALSPGVYWVRIGSDVVFVPAERPPREALPSVSWLVDLPAREGEAIVSVQRRRSRAVPSADRIPGPGGRLLWPYDVVQEDAARGELRRLLRSWSRLRVTDGTQLVHAGARLFLRATARRSGAVRVTFDLRVDVVATPADVDLTDADLRLTGRDDQERPVTRTARLERPDALPHPHRARFVRVCAGTYRIEAVPPLRARLPTIDALRGWSDELHALLDETLGSTLLRVVDVDPDQEPTCTLEALRACIRIERPAGSGGLPSDSVTRLAALLRDVAESREVTRERATIVLALAALLGPCDPVEIDEAIGLLEDVVAARGAVEARLLLAHCYQRCRRDDEADEQLAWVIGVLRGGPARR